MDGSSRVDWTNLPPQLYPLIAQNLKTHIEFLRFRSVCSSWRSSIPPFCASISPNFPFPHGPNGFLSKITVYLTRSNPNPDPNPNPNPNPNPSSSSSSSPSSSKGWLLKLEECADKIRLLNPITNWRVISVNDDVSRNPTDLNLVDLNTVELGKAYALRYTKGSGSIFGINKVIVAPNFKDCSIFMIYNEGKLGFAQIGNEKLTLINDQNSDYHDLIVYKGQPCVVNKWGQIFRINSSLELVSFSPPIGFGCRRNLIECCGELYVVDRYLDQHDKKSQELPVRNASFNFFHRHPVHGLHRRLYEADRPKAVDFNVYKLGDEELGGRWVEVKNLGGQAFFLSVDCCFSVLAAELEGCKGNCIYFTDSNDIGFALRELISSDGSVFSLEDHSIQWLSSSPVYSQMFWPVPT